MAKKNVNRPHRSKPYENKLAERRIARNPRGMRLSNPLDVPDQQALREQSGR